MDQQTEIKRSRGRPRKDLGENQQAREILIRKGMELLTEKGFINTGLTELLAETNIPKGSFYHYFKSKDAFGLEVLQTYGAYFDRLLDGYLLDESVTPLQRLRNFITGAVGWIEKHEFKRGCLIGNMGQEASALDQVFCEQLEGVFEGWQARIAACLELARDTGDIPLETDCTEMGAFFWIGWEGAVLRAKLIKSTAPLTLFETVFFAQLQHSK